MSCPVTLSAAAQERWARIEKFVMQPRGMEKAAIEAKPDPGKKRYPVRYDYGSELFSVRRKGFFPLLAMAKLLDEFIPGLSHESDGLIFQVQIRPGLLVDHPIRFQPSAAPRHSILSFSPKRQSHSAGLAVPEPKGTSRKY